MDIVKEYLLSQYEELGELNGNPCVSIVRNTVTGRIAVRKRMGIGQKQIYDFLKAHPSCYTPEIYECVEDGEQLIVIEEYFEGQNLEELLYDKALSEEEAYCIVADLCCALEPLHTAEPAIVCRDLKPENIMITPQRDVKLIDFDIARTVSPGKGRDTVVLGTKGFAAPEQCGYAQTDGRSDIYALGAILNYCVLRKLPAEKMADGKLGKVIEKCTALSPDDRYQSVGELLKALDRIYLSDTPERWDRKAERKNKAHEYDGHRHKSGEEWEEDENGYHAWRRFLPPGFRSGRVWKMIVAVFGYLLVFSFSMSMEVKVENVVITGVRAWLQQILFLMSQLTEIGIVFDYMGCQSRMPFFKAKSRLWRLIIYIAMEFLLILAMAVIWAIIDTMIWG